MDEEATTIVEVVEPVEAIIKEIAGYKLPTAFAPVNSVKHNSTTQFLEGIVNNALLMPICAFEENLFSSGGDRVPISKPMTQLREANAKRVLGSKDVGEDLNYRSCQLCENQIEFTCDKFSCTI
ncbi:unnamed protein product [Calypogeia fissa]